MAEITTTDATFEQDVIEKSKEMPVLVDFWASWCPPCQMLKPIIEKVANSEEYKDKIILAKLNTEENQTIPQKYNVSSIPDVKLFKNGEVVDGFVGVQQEEQIKEFIDKNL